MSLLLLALLLAGWPPALPQADRFAGTWVSTDGKSYNVIVMEADGRFRSEHYTALKVGSTMEGRWQVRGDSIVWTYLNPKVEGEDVNPIASAGKDRFALREKNGALTHFYRKGVVDPLSPAVLPIAVGTGWVLEDDMGEVGIRIGGRQEVNGLDCYRVDWVDAMLNGVYQSELWAVKEDGVYAVGRSVLGRSLPFEKPYRLLGRTPVAGEKWDAVVATAIRTEPLKFSVGAEEEVKTPAGTFKAIPVTLEGDVVVITRWFARGIGLVREQSNLNAKNLKRRIE